MKKYKVTLVDPKRNFRFRPYSSATEILVNKINFTFETEISDAVLLSTKFQALLDCGILTIKEIKDAPAKVTRKRSRSKSTNDEDGESRSEEDKESEQ